MFKKYQLKNGMRILLVESHKSPVLSIQMWVKTGSADEKKGEEGISHFIEHLVFKGSRKFSVGEIAAAVEGAGGELNAYTSFDQTVFYVTISKEFQDVGMEVIAEMMGFPLFDEKEIHNEREVVLEEIKRSNDSPHRQASRLLFSTFYKKHPYGTPVIGFADNIKSVSRDTLVKYYRGRYNPKNMTLVVAGDFSAPEMRAQVEERFGAFQVNKLRAVKRRPVAKSKKPGLVVKKEAFEETIFHLAFPAPKASHKDVAALEMLALILGQGESSRLNKRLRIDQHLVNSVGSSLFLARDPGFFAISASLNEKEMERTLDALLEELTRILSEPVSESEVRKALTNLASEQFYHLETVDGMARNLGQYQDLFGDPSYFEKFIRQVQTLTAKDLLRVARRYLTHPGLTFIVMTPAGPGSIEPLLKGFLAKAKRDFKAAASGNKKRREDRGERSEGKTKSNAKKVSFVFHKPAKVSTEPRKIPLANGVNVIVRPSFDTPVISVRCASLGGSRLEEAATQGTIELLSRVWTAGAGRFSEVGLNARIDELASNLSAFGGRNSQGLSMVSLRTFEAEMLELFCLALREPHFEEAAIAREKKAMLEHVKLRKDNPAQLCVLEFMKALFSDHPYGRDPYGDESAIGRLSRASVERLFAGTSGLTLVASGAIDPEEFCGRLERQLDGFKVGRQALKPFPVTYPQKDLRLFQESKKEQSHVIFGFPGLTLKDPKRYTLQVMQAILAGQGGRLFLELRDKASLAYSVTPMRMEGLEGGYFGAYIGCSPEKVETALRMMQKEFNKLRDTKVPQGELSRAQRYLIGKHDIELQKNSNITSSILFDEIYGIDFLETYRYPERIRAVSAGDIQSLAEMLFARSSVVSLVGPKPAADPQKS